MTNTTKNQSCIFRAPNSVILQQAGQYLSYETNYIIAWKNDFILFFSERNIWMTEIWQIKIVEIKHNSLNRNETDQYLSHVFDICADRKKRFAAFDRRQNRPSVMGIGFPHFRFRPRFSGHFVNFDEFQYRVR